MGFQLAEHPKVYIQRTIVLTYVIKILQGDLIKYESIISDLSNEMRNLKALCSQGGVQFLYKKILDQSIVVRIRYKNVIETLKFDKKMLIQEAHYFVLGFTKKRKLINQYQVTLHYIV